MRRNTIGIAAATLAAAGVIGVAGAALASAADTTATPSPSATSSTAPGGNRPGGPGGASKDTAVTGSEADKVIAAVKAKDSTATITTVRQDPDGSYDAIGTKSGNPVFYDVSADLKTITAGGGHGGPGGPGGSQDTAVSGSQADKVIAAVKAKDSTATITTVRQDPDGSYDAIGTKGGNPVFYDVSADLKTVTAMAGPAGGHGGPPDGTAGTPAGPGASSNTSSNPADANGATAI